MENGMAGAIALLPESLEEELQPCARVRSSAEEIRLRAGKCAGVVSFGEEHITGKRPVTQKELEQVLEIATDASFYAADTIRSGYITARGGYRIGICGKGAVTDGRIQTIGELSSLCIRIPRQHAGIAENAAKILCENGFRSTLIVSPPGGGKTTFLRDLVRSLSDGTEYTKPVTVGLCDERGEIACMGPDGIAYMNIGKHTDVMTGVKKADGAMMLLKTMAPRIIAMDEITSADDIAAVSECFSCGTEIIATAHASSMEDLYKRKLYTEVLKLRVFAYIVFITKTGRQRQYTVIRTEENGW